MKELLIEEKAKRYDKAIERAKNYYSTTDSASDIKLIGLIFPELKESEGERIRKALIETFSRPPGHNCVNVFNGIPHRKIVAWLEKIGSQNLANYAKTCKDEQKPVNTDYISGVRKELLSIEDNAENTNGLTESQWVAIRAAHRLLGECIAKEQKPEWSSEQSKTLQTDNVSYKSSTDAHLWTRAIGFDGEPMESKPCEQNPAWNEEDEKYIADLTAYFTEGVSLKHNEEDIAKWLKSLKDRVNPQPQQKWSEEDEEIYQSIMDDTVQENQLNGKQTDWLRDIKYRYFPQSKSEWSKEDEAFYQRLEQIVCKVDIEAFQGDRDLHSWLKSLKPNNRWKPSDEQMEALRYVTNFDYGGHKATLVSIYEQLKKLK